MVAVASAYVCVSCGVIKTVGVQFERNGGASGCIKVTMPTLSWPSWRWWEACCRLQLVEAAAVNSITNSTFSCRVLALSPLLLVPPCVLNAAPTQASNSATTPGARQQEEQQQPPPALLLQDCEHLACDPTSHAGTFLFCAEQLARCCCGGLASAAPAAAASLLRRASCSSQRDGSGGGPATQHTTISTAVSQGPTFQPGSSTPTPT